MSDSTTIFLVHGMFMTRECWGPLRAHLEGLGHRCVAPSWPCREGDPAALRAEPDSGLSSLTLPMVVDAMRAEIEKLDAPPVVVGHSMGGLVAQLLAQQGLAERVVAIAPAPPYGVRSFAYSHLKSNAALLWPSSAPVVPSFSWFRYAFANQGSDEDARALYERYAVPESRLVGRGPLEPASTIDFARAGVPMLFLSGREDRIIPSSLVAKVVARYEAAGADVAHQVFDATHLGIADGSAEAVAAAVGAWVG